MYRTPFLLFYIQAFDSSDACQEYFCGNGVVEATDNIVEQCDGTIDPTLAASLAADPNILLDEADLTSWDCNMGKCYLPRQKMGVFCF